MYTFTLLSVWRVDLKTKNYSRYWTTSTPNVVSSTEDLFTENVFSSEELIDFVVVQ